MIDISQRVEELKQIIERAFAHTPLPPKGQLFGASKRDPDRQDTEKHLAGKLWRNLTDVEIDHSDIHTLSIQGWRYYLPAFILRFISDPNHPAFFVDELRLSGDLWPEGYVRKHLEALSQEEFVAVKQYVKLGAEFGWIEAEAAWLTIWKDYER